MNADYPGTTHVVPAHPSNYYPQSGHNGIPNRPRALVLHTPEEGADDNEVTPRYFSQQNFNEDGSPRQASTHYYADSDGDWYQLVPELCAAIANGLKGKPMPAWADPNTSLNWQTLSVEMEGYAATIHKTMPRGGAQWNAVVRWVADRCATHSIPLDRAHVIGHYEVANNRTDPGQLDIDQIVRDATALGAPQALEDDCLMPVPWVRDDETKKSYFIVGGKKRYVDGPEQEAALLKAGYIQTPEVMMTTAELATIPDA